MGFIYFNQDQLKERVYHKYILKDNQYSLNPSQYRQAFSYQKARQRSCRDTDWYIPKFKRTKTSRSLWRYNTCWLPHKNWIETTYCVIASENPLRLHDQKLFLKDSPIAQKILGFFLWRPSDVPKEFSDYYRSP